MSDAGFTQRLQALQSRLGTLPDKPEETADSTLRVLWHLACGQALSSAAADEAPGLPVLDAPAEARLDQLMARRLAGEPLAHLSGRQRFMGLEMLAGKEALIPRQETEVLAHAALARARRMLSTHQASTLRVVDICTGSGNLALALAHHEPRTQVFAADLSPEAVSLAARNAAHLGMASRVEWRCGDLLAPFEEPAFLGSVDLLTCNPPYISSQKVDALAREIGGHEPRLAFDGGALGVSVLNRLIRQAPRFLRPGGWLVVEVGAGQAGAVARRLQASTGRFDVVEQVTDAQGAPRVVAARAAETSLS